MSQKPTSSKPPPPEEEVTAKIEMDKELAELASRARAAKSSSISQVMKALRERLEEKGGYRFIDPSRRSRPDFG